MLKAAIDHSTATRTRAEKSNFTGNLAFPTVAVFVLLFAATAIYGGEADYVQVFLAAAVFALGDKALRADSSGALGEITKLTAPLLVIACLSLAQGVLTSFAIAGGFEIPFYLPQSYNAASSIFAAAKIFAFVVFFGSLLIVFRGARQRLVWILIAAGNFFALVALVRFVLQLVFPEVFGWFWLPALNPGTGFGTFINQNHFAFSMLMNLGLTGGLLIFGDVGKTSRLLLAGGALLSWAAIVLTASRGGILCSLPVILVLYGCSLFSGKSVKNAVDARLRNFRIFKKSAIFLILLVALVFGVALIGRERVAQRFEEIPIELTGTSQTGFRRIEVWQATVRMISKQPLFGVGFGGFPVAASQYLEISGTVLPEAAHNDYLDLTASGGAFAAACVIWFAWRFFRIFGKAIRRAEDGYSRAVRCGALAALTGAAAQSLFDYGLQNAANWLYFAAVLSLAVGDANLNSEKSAKKSGKSVRLWRYVLLAASLLCFWFALAKLENRLITSDLEFFSGATKVFTVPFDADFYAARALADEKKGNRAAAFEDIKLAIKWRPQDFALWLAAGRMAERLGQRVEAENDLRQAVRLAPFYAEPRRALGNFYLRHGRQSEAFAELRIAVARRRSDFEEIFETIYQAVDGDAARALEILSPLDADLKSRAAKFLLEKKDYATLTRLACDADGFDENTRRELVQRLFELRRFREADNIFRRDCRKSAEPSAARFLDGGFENAQFENNLGFGWRTGELPETVRLGFDDEIKTQAEKSLAIDFEGNSDPSTVLISQTMIVEKSHRYRLLFKLRHENIRTGGVPVWQLILKKTGADALAGEIRLDEGKDNVWIEKSFEFQTDSVTQALEIRFARKSCTQMLCPIFGRLWLDDMRLEPTK